MTDDLPEFERITLAPDEYLLLTPKEGGEFTAEVAAQLAAQIPETLKGRVLVFSPDIAVKVVSARD